MMVPCLGTPEILNKGAALFEVPTSGPHFREVTIYKHGNSSKENFLRRSADTDVEQAGPTKEITCSVPCEGRLQGLGFGV